VAAHIATASGKLLLFGEHAAVYGYPALGTALPLSLKLEILPRGDMNAGQDMNTGRNTFDAVPKGYRDRIRELFDTIPQAVAAISDSIEKHAAERKTSRSRDGSGSAGLPPVSPGRPPGEVRIQSGIPVSCGFGSSAAFCTALSRIILEETAPEPTLVWKLAHELERYFHGAPSGIDTGLSTLGGTLAFRFIRPGLPDAQAVPLPEGAIVIGSTPRTGNTRDLVMGLKKRMTENDSVVTSAMRTLGGIAEEAIDVCITGAASGISRLGECAVRAQESLRTLDLSSDDLESCIDTGMRAGALGGKLSGAGGGGAFYLVYPGIEAARDGAYRIGEFLRTRHGTGLPVFAARTGPEGITAL
jgi:mevalonate kinase